jgi:hypothetical protein
MFARRILIVESVNKKIAAKGTQRFVNFGHKTRMGVEGLWIVTFSM